MTPSLATTTTVSFGTHAKPEEMRKRRSGGIGVATLFLRAQRASPQKRRLPFPVTTTRTTSHLRSRRDHTGWPSLALQFH